MASRYQTQPIHFGPFKLAAARRRLYCNGDEVQLGGRAMDVLIALAARKGALATREELFSAAWPGICVHDSNLKVTIAYLRRALREHDPHTEYINTVVGRGYWLGLDECASEPDKMVQHNWADMRLPEIDMMVGREQDIAIVCNALAAERLVTIAGAGGIGKTTVAIAAAQIFSDQGRGAVSFVDFGDVVGEEFVISALAAALGVSVRGDALPAIVSILARRRALLILDTCEHVLAAVAHLCEVVLSNTRDIQILTTSRQVLRAKAEKVIWLPPLSLPPLSEADNLPEVLAWGAPAMLHARAREHGYSPQTEEAAALAQVCRRLEGMPLAIELVSARLAERGANALLAELDERFLTFSRDTSSAPERQRTLLLTLRWSYATLTDREASVLRAVSAFAGPFDTAGAVKVTSASGFRPDEIFDAIGGLRSKSMLSVDQEALEPRYHLLDSTRAFSRDLLERSGEISSVASRHAQLQLDLLEAAGERQATMPARNWRRAYGGLLGDLRSALDWSLGRSNDPVLGIRLVAAGLPLWQEMSLGAEIDRNCRRALAEFRRLDFPDKSLELALVGGLASVSTYLSDDPEHAAALFRRAIALAREIGDASAECRALAAFATYDLMPGRGGAVAETLAEMRAAVPATGEPAARWEEEQLRAQWEIRICDFDMALRRVKRLFAELQDDAEQAVPRFQIHQKMNVEVQLAALHWLTGRPQRAADFAEIAARDASEVEHGLTLIHCLAQGVVWTLLQCRDHIRVKDHIESLRNAIFRHGMAAWIPVANCYSVVVAAMEGENPDPAELRAAFDAIRGGMVQLRHDARYAMLAEAMLANGQAHDAALVVDHVFSLNPRPWGYCEFLRLRAATEGAFGRPREAEAILKEAVEAARSIGSPAWELRSTYDLAFLLSDRGRRQQARDLLRPIATSFDEKSARGDLAKARLLLREVA